MFPFKMRSLTKKIDDEIHLAVRRQSPGKYFAFRFLDLFARMGFAFGFSALILYCLIYMVLRAKGYLVAGEFADMAHGFAYVITTSITIGVVGGLFREIMLNDLEKIARNELSRV